MQVPFSLLLPAHANHLTHTPFPIRIRDQTTNRSVDKKLYKELWALLKRVPLLPLAGSVVWLPLELCLSLLPVKSSTLTIEAARKAELDALRQLDADLVKEVANIKQVGARAHTRAHPARPPLLAAVVLMAQVGVKSTLRDRLRLQSNQPLLPPATRAGDD